MTYPGTRIRLAVVDDHRMLLSALTQWIQVAADDINVVAAVTTWPALLTHPEFPVDVVLLDLDLKDNIPVSLKISTLKTAGVKTVLMSSYSEPALVRQALAAGALGYIVKSEDANAIVQAIRAACNGASYVSEELDLALSAAGELSESPRLSDQERLVMGLYAAGEALKSVAYRLGISDETAKSYLKRVREKYRRAGYDLGTKVEIRKAAIHDGILLESEEFVPTVSGRLVQTDQIWPGNSSRPVQVGQVGRRSSNSPEARIPELAGR